MVLQTKRITLQRFLVYLYIVSFPMGQMLRISGTIMGVHVALLGHDVIVGLIFISCLYTVGIKETYRQMKSMVWVSALFSSVIFLSQHFELSSLVGLLYLLRVIGYVGLFVVVKSEINRGLSILHLKKLMIIMVGVTATFGLLQYIYYPDLITLVAFGWDAHLYRLVGTFLDPGFIGAILVLGFILSFRYFTETTDKRAYVTSVALVIPLLLTYSRASYLAFCVASFVLMLYSKWSQKLLIAVILVLFILSIPVLPRPRGVGVDLTRTHSVVTRVTNYEVTYEVWKTSPVFGVGYNNLCVAKQLLDFQETGQNSCSGSDSSLLFILTTIGLVGVVLGIYEILIHNSLRVLMQDGLLVASLSAIMVHSFFLNSLFYPWILTYLIIQFAIHKIQFVRMEID